MSSLRTFPLGFPPGNVPASWVPQGVGKTTLLRIILGLEQPDHGTIQGQVRPVSAVFQENRLFEDFSALSNAAVVAPKGTGRRPPATSPHWGWRTAYPSLSVPSAVE